MDNNEFVQEYAYARVYADNNEELDVKGNVIIHLCGDLPEGEEEEFSRGVVVIDIIGE